MKIDLSRRLFLRQISVVISSIALNGCGKTSDNNSPPKIVQHPTSIETVIGEPAVFKVIATGKPPLLYQWYRNNKPINEAISDTYTYIPSSRLDNNSKLSVKVTNDIGVTKSNSAVLKIQIRATRIDSTLLNTDNTYISIDRT